MQGETFPVYSSGEWAARVALTEGDNIVTLTTTDGQSVSKNIFLKKREAPQPIDGPRAENVQILPSSDMALSPGDAVRIRLNAAPGAKIAWIGGEPLYEVSQGVFQGQYTVQPGERIAQMIIMPYFAPVIEEVTSLTETDRGAGGFGSTGTK